MPSTVSVDGTDFTDLLRRATRHRALLGSLAFLGAFVIASLTWGIPRSRDELLLWIVVALFASTLNAPGKWKRLVVDWFPLAVILLGYDLLRGMAQNVHAAHLEPQIAFDKLLGFGTPPTVRLQHALFDPSGFPHWWEWILFVIYLSHFCVSLLVAAWIWRFDYPRFRRFVVVFLGVTLLAYITFALYPTIPPWLASRHHAIGHVVRVVHRVFKHAGLQSAGQLLFSRHSKLANLVAAVPSLHAAWPMLITLFFWRRAGKWRIALVAYDLLMAFSLVYGAEHYVFDIFVGWAYAAVAYFVGSELYERWQRARALRALRAAPALAAGDLPHPPQHVARPPAPAD